MSDTYLSLPAGFRERVADNYLRQIQQDYRKFDNVGITRSDWIQTQQSFRILQKVEMTETTGIRGGDTLQAEPQVAFRSGFLRDFEVVEDFDINDKDRLYSAERPDSEVIQNMRSAWARRMDDIIIDAAQAVSYGGAKPYITPASSLPAAMEIPVTWDTISNGATNTNLTIWKVQEAIARMQEQDVDLDREMAVLAIHPRVEQAWLRYAMSAPNTPFAMAFMPWYNNNTTTPKKFLGCEVIVSNRLRKTGNIYNCLLFTKSAFYTSPPKFDLRIDIIPTKRHMTQIAVYAKMGAVRIYDEKVNIIYSDSSVAITY